MKNKANALIEAAFDLYAPQKDGVERWCAVCDVGFEPANSINAREVECIVEDVFGALIDTKNDELAHMWEGNSYTAGEFHEAVTIYDLVQVGELVVLKTEDTTDETVPSVFVEASATAKGLMERINKPLNLHHTMVFVYTWEKDVASTGEIQAWFVSDAANTLLT